MLLSPPGECGFVFLVVANDSWDFWLRVSFETYFILETTVRALVKVFPGQLLIDTRSGWLELGKA